MDASQTFPRDGKLADVSRVAHGFATSRRSRAVGERRRQDLTEMWVCTISSTVAHAELTNLSMSQYPAGRPAVSFIEVGHDQLR